MIKRPLVSILINNYNYGRYLSQAIESALNQDYSELEVIVVDDGSQDESQEILSRYSSTQITTILKSNGGQASAFNAGFLASTGDIICFLDSDDYFYRHKVSNIVSLLDKMLEISWIFHKLDYVDKEGNLALIDRAAEGIQHFEVVDFREVFAKGKRFTYAIPCGLCFKRSLLAKILPMPESTGVTISDNYLKYSALALSPGLLLPRPLAVQRIHDSNIYTMRSDNQKLRAEINVKTGFYLRKNFSQAKLFSDKIFTRGCGEMLIEGSYKELWEFLEFREYLYKYTSTQFWIRFIPTLLFHGIRFQWLKFRAGS